MLNKDIKFQLTEEHIRKIMKHLGVEGRLSMDGKSIAFRTICHDGDNDKLYYYINEHRFVCFTNCGNMDVFQVIQNVTKCTFVQALNLVKQITGLDNHLTRQYGFSTDILNNPFEYTPTEIKKPEFKIINEFVLASYTKLYHKSFIDDYISIEVMQKHELAFDILMNRVIIPHRNCKSELVAIRARNFDEKYLNAGRKYLPVNMFGKSLSSPTSIYFYGLYHYEKNIRKTKTVIIGEAEKFSMQVATLFPEMAIGISAMGSNISQWHIEILEELGVENVIIAFDKEFEEIGSEEEELYKSKIEFKIIERLRSKFNVGLMWDKHNLLGYKDAPTDRGRETFLKLYNDMLIYKKY